MRGPGPTQHFPMSGFGGNSTRESSPLGNLPESPLRVERAVSWETGTSGADLGLFQSRRSLLCLLVSHRYLLRLTTARRGSAPDSQLDRSYRERREASTSSGLLGLPCLQEEKATQIFLMFPIFKG